MTVTEPTSPGDCSTVFPDDACDVPLASNLNFAPGQTVPNLVMIRLSTFTGCAIAAGADDFYNFMGSTHVVVDVFGYFTNSSATLSIAGPPDTATWQYRLQHAWPHPESLRAADLAAGSVQ